MIKKFNNITFKNEFCYKYHRTILQLKINKIFNFP